MICHYCKNEMIKDDEDFRFKGNTDIYWLCEHCGASCIELIRFGKRFKVNWHKGEAEETNGTREELRK